MNYVAKHAKTCLYQLLLSLDINAKGLSFTSSERSALLLMSLWNNREPETTVSTNYFFLIIKYRFCRRFLLNII
jgi:hypothetical protein